MDTHRLRMETFISRVPNTQPIMPLPTYTYNRITYTVDYRLAQFRYIPPTNTLKKALKTFRFYDFDSPEGDRILTKMIKDGKADLSKLNL